MRTFELLDQLAPTKYEKKRIADLRGYKSVNSIWQECEDPERSGRRNCFDEVLIYVDHALIHHPDAALALAQHLSNYVRGALAAAAGALPVGQLILKLQPTSEKESMEAVSALSTALRQMVLGGSADSEPLLREIEEAGRELDKMAVMLRASMRAE
jgi:hypothetical protein